MITGTLPFRRFRENYAIPRPIRTLFAITAASAMSLRSEVEG